MVYIILKRFIDLLLSFIALIFLLPILIILSLAIKLDSHGPIFFRQLRVGKNKSLFYILKFRTMSIDSPKDTPTHLLSNPEKYITRMGKFLRKTSMDELPQIWNIFIGEMSIVGPRPALWNQYDLIEARDLYGANRFRPGLTGLAQINGRDELSIEAKSKLDGEYILKMSFWMDVKCVFGTVISVFKQKGIVEGGTESISQQEVATSMECVCKSIQG